jgi:hypothetical protein
MIKIKEEVMPRQNISSKVVGERRLAQIWML